MRIFNWSIKRVVNCVASFLSGFIVTAILQKRIRPIVISIFLLIFALTAAIALPLQSPRSVLAVPGQLNITAPIGSNLFPGGAWTSDGKVGIGTTNPTHKLQINTSDNASGIALTNTTDSSIILKTNASNAPMITTGGGLQSLLFGINGTEYMRLKSDGNVGIGTTGPNSKLTIEGSSPVAEIRSGGYLMLRPSGNDWDMRLQAGGAAGSATLNVFQGGDLVNPLVTIKQNGNVGIGTAGPGAKLSVAGDIQIANAGALTTVTGGTSLNIYPLTSGSAGGIQLSSDGNMSFLKNDGNVQVKFNNGNVGIGTAGPTHLLSLGSATNNVPMKFGGSTALTYLGQTAINNYVIGAAEGDTFIRNDTAGIVFSAGDNGGTVRMKITSTGNVGIGTVSPGQKLEVNGNVKVDGAGIYNSAGYQLVETNATDWTRWNQGGGSTNGNAMYQSLALGNGGLAVGTWSNQSAGNIYLTGYMRGGDYGFGGKYRMQWTEGPSWDCKGTWYCGVANPFTGGCSCPAGFSSFTEGSVDGPGGGCATIYTCYK